jgi:FkbM family methyltransferase
VTDTDKAAAKWVDRDLATLDQACDLAKHHRVAVQAGGLHGAFARQLSLSFHVVHCFEPDPRLFSLCARAIDWRAGVRLYNAALGFERGPVRTVQARRDGDKKRNAHAGVTHVVPGTTAGGASIATLRIDDLGLEVCDLIVLDVEGYEFEALRGAIDTIERCHPVIMVEINSNLTAMGLTSEDLRTYLRLRGYETAKKIHSDEIFTWRGNEHQADRGG